MSELQAFKERIKSPLLLHSYGVWIGELANSDLGDYVYGVDLNLQKFDIRQYKLGNRTYPWFYGRKEEALNFTMRFMERHDGYVSDQLDKYYEAIYDETGLINLRNLKRLMFPIRIYQMDSMKKPIVLYVFRRCMFVEDTNLAYSNESQDPMIISVQVYAMGYRRFVGKKMLQSAKWFRS